MSTPPPEYGYPSQPNYGYQPAPANSAVGSAPRAKNIPGRISLAAGVVLVLLTLTAQVISLSLPILVDRMQVNPMQVVQPLNLIQAILTVIFGIIAVVFGVIGLIGGPKPRGAAGAGLAVGILSLLTALLQVVMSAGLTMM